MNKSAVININFGESGEIVSVEIARTRRHNRFFLYHPTRTSMRRMLYVAEKREAVFKMRSVWFVGQDETTAKRYYLEAIFDVRAQ